MAADAGPVVALLGTGIMGAAMGRNVARRGMPLRVWNRTRERAEPLAADGAVVAASPAEAVADADVVVTMLDDGDTVRAVMADAAPALRRGAVWAQMSTVGVAAVAPLAELAAAHGVVFVDAPVQGTKQPAEQGTLVILAAGPQPARDALAPVFDAIGQRTVWVGEDGAAGGGSRLKMVTVSFSLAVTTAVAEALALAEGLGVDPRLFGEVVGGGPMDSPYVQVKSRAIIAGDYTPSFATRHAAKDTGLIVEAATAAGVKVDGAAASHARFQRAVAQGHGDEDMAATYFASFD